MVPSTQALSHIELANMEDESLVQQTCQSRAAFAELYHRYFHQVYRYHYARTGNVQDAQDLTTQTFMAALEGISGFQRRGCFAAWLMGIARNKAISHFKKRKSEVSLEAVTELSHPAPAPEETVTERIRSTHLIVAVKSLSPDRAETLTLSIFAGLSAAETASVMGKSEAAVRMLIYRGIQDLKNKLLPIAEGL